MTDKGGLPCYCFTSLVVNLMLSSYMWLETCSSVASFLGLKLWTLEVAVGFSCAPWSSGFQERHARRSAEARNSSRPASSSLEIWDPRQAVVLTTFLELLTLAIIGTWYLFWHYRHLTSTSWLGYVVPKYYHILHYMKRPAECAQCQLLFLYVCVLFLLYS